MQVSLEYVGGWQDKKQWVALLGNGVFLNIETVWTANDAESFGHKRSN